jgi:ferritin-like metal-binding protein YciE
MNTKVNENMIELLKNQYLWEKQALKALTKYTMNRAKNFGTKKKNT